jgi:UDP-N-acetylmuramyl pentapeptide phosphotransferase/UDP-N-acetylglucosamine-1-phosphate transferase
MNWPIRRENFAGRQIPTGTGIVFAIAILAGYAAVFTYIWSTGSIQPGELLLDRESPGSRIALCWLALVLSSSLFGLLDDAFGRHGGGGFRGHLGALLRGRVTTGLIKAAGGGFTALFVAYWLQAEFSPTLLVVDTLVIALAMNAFNLLDLRPGRAFKVFFPLVLLFLFAPASVFWFLPAVVPVLLTALALFAYDIRAKVMLGDAGSNVLGAIAGLGFAVILGFLPKLAVLLILVAVNAASEKWSFSKIIESVPFLRWYDNLGRPGNNTHPS